MRGSLFIMFGDGAKVGKNIRNMLRPQIGKNIMILPRPQS